MKVYEVLDLPPAMRTKGAKLGIECETEGRVVGVHDDIWRSEPDGSLRNGIEYVSVPLNLEQVEPSIIQLHKAIKDDGGKAEYSFRCSTHVHVNVQELTENQLMSMIFLYMMYENVFMNFVANERVGNRFCLRFQDAQNLTHEVSAFFRRCKEEDLRHGMAHLRQNELKYAALNLFTLKKYGTLEFRALEGTSDAKKIATWATAIVNLRTVAMRWNDPRRLYEKFIQDPEELADQIFGHARDKFLKPGWHEQVEEGYSQNQAILMEL